MALAVNKELTSVEKALVSNQNQDRLLPYLHQ